MEQHETTRPSRRRFMIWGLAGGAAVAGASFPFWRAGERRTQKLPTEERLVRNPAFASRQDDQNGLVLSTIHNGQTLGFRLSADAGMLWKSIVTRDEADAGKESTVQQVLDRATASFPAESAAQVRAEALAFLREAEGAGLLLSESTIMYHSYEGRRS